MGWSKDIALDEINKFPVEGGFKDFLVAKTHEFFDAPVEEAEVEAAVSGEDEDAETEEDLAPTETEV